MSNVAKYNAPGTWATLTVSGLNSLANNSATLSALYDNSTNLDLLMDLSIQLPSYNAALAAPYFELHIVNVLDDGSTYAQTSPQTQVATIALSAGTSAKALFVQGIPIPPNQFYFWFVNISGGTTNSTGNSVKIRTYNYNLNG